MFYILWDMVKRQMVDRTECSTSFWRSSKKQLVVFLYFCSSGLISTLFQLRSNGRRCLKARLPVSLVTRKILRVYYGTNQSPTVAVSGANSHTVPSIDTEKHKVHGFSVSCNSKGNFQLGGVQCGSEPWETFSVKKAGLFSFFFTSTLIASATRSLRLLENIS